VQAHVVALQLHALHGSPLRPVREVNGRVGGGIEGDSHVDRAKRAVVLADRSTHEALGLVPGDLREQITVEGLPGVSLLPPDTEIRVGGLTLRVVGACEPCTHIGEMVGVDDVEAFQASLQGRRGAVCTVIAATGPARIGDPVDVLPARVRV
jgi:MOSC domain-containing protein YiiM